MHTVAPSAPDSFSGGLIFETLLGDSVDILPILCIAPESFFRAGDPDGINEIIYPNFNFPTTRGIYLEICGRWGVVVYVTRNCAMGAVGGWDEGSWGKSRSLQSIVFLCHVEAVN